MDVARVRHMYRADMPEGSVQKSALYGSGFTIFGLLDDDCRVDRSDVVAKIRNRFFDLVIFGSVRRCTAYINEVLANYSSEKIVFVDGEDDQIVVTSLLGRGLYFKREMAEPFRTGFPIQFAIPAEKLLGEVPKKIASRAHIDPRDRTTYIFDNERDYYSDYSASLFGTTMKKAGWDCLRHYEIMANRCIPDFIDLESCPAWTMYFMPKYELIEIRRLIGFHGVEYFSTSCGFQIWKEFEDRIFSRLRRYMTTEALAKYVVETSLSPGSHYGLS
ncbi:hypothetical protein [Methylobacterium sp. CM6257]